MNGRMLGLALGVAVISLIWAGCGGGGDSTESTASISKSAFLKQGNAICAKGNEEVNKGFEEFAEEKGLKLNKRPPQPVLEEAAEQILIPAIGKQLEGLRALGTPEGDEGELDQLLTSAEEALEKGEEEPASLTDQGPSPFTEVNEEANAYGLTACGEEEGNEGQ